MNRPPDTNLSQQRLKTRPGSVTPLYMAIALIIIGIIFIPTGTDLIQDAKNVYEIKQTYDNGKEYDCFIHRSNQGKNCQVTFNINSHVNGPIYLYYQLTNFYQNHRRYYLSRSLYQLTGELLDDDDVELACNPLYKNDSLLLNPCGLIANSFFNDEISLNRGDSDPSNKKLDETGISIYSDRDQLFKQVNGFKSKKVDNNETTCHEANLPHDCDYYYDHKKDQAYLFYYPRNDQVQYLYESYPNQISPIDGVEDEHFIVWMRTAGLPNFRKLYGTIEGDLHPGDKLVFDIVANYEVHSFDSSKSLILTNLGEFGGKNIVTGQSYMTVGIFALTLGCAMFVKSWFF